MIAHYLLWFACGALVKLADNLVDEPFKPRRLLAYASSVLYGLIAGFLATRSSEFATMVLAITVGVLVAGKIDSREHQVGVASLLFFVALFGLPSINLGLLVLFISLGFFDELLNDFVVVLKERGIKVNGLAAKAVNARASLEVGAAAVGFYSGNFTYFLALLSFDAAYNVVDKAMPFLLERFHHRYGPQLALDLYKCSAKRLASKALIQKLLNELPSKMGMRKISRPRVLEYKAEKSQDSGLSGFVLIAESHITIHTYPVQCFAKIDVVSCKRFEYYGIVAYLKRAFLAKEAEVKLLDRGKRYPSDENKAMLLVERERMEAFS